MRFVWPWFDTVYVWPPPRIFVPAGHVLVTEYV